MERPAVTREDMVRALREALEPVDSVHAMWEAGAAAFDRIDEWSDLDIQIDVDDERVEETLEIVEKALTDLSGIELTYRLPEPTPHGHAQVFHRVKNASRFHLIDLVVMKHSDPNKFLERDIHGEPTVFFDKSNVVLPQTLDRGALTTKLRARLTALRLKFDMFQPFVLKEINRGNGVEALVYYQGATLRPLVEALGIRHRPERYDFYTRYVYYEFPSQVVQRLEELFFIESVRDLEEKREKAEAWFYNTLGEIGEAADFSVDPTEES